MRSLLLIVLVAGVLVTGCTSPQSGDGATDSSSPTQTTTSPTTTASTTTAGGTRSVNVADNEFVDGDFTIVSGTTVTYTNVGAGGHTVTIHWVGDPATTLKLDQTIQPGQSAQFTFATTGTYHVWCRFHGTMTSGMASVVTVE